MAEYPRGTIRPGGYKGNSVRERILALFLDNIGKVVTREQIQEVATDPDTGKVPENWHQRLSELRTDYGYTILSWRDRSDLKVMEYLMPNDKRRDGAGRRVGPTKETWEKVLKRSDRGCEWDEASGKRCGLRAGDLDPVGGGTVSLTPDHKSPHSVNPNADPEDPDKWQALCGRHQVVKKNYWDHLTGKLNVMAIIQGSSSSEKKKVYAFLKQYFGEDA